MTSLILFLEEPSAEEMLKGLLPRLLPDHVPFRCVVFEGKQDLEKRIGRKLRGWQAPDAWFVVLRDKDAGDCRNIKQGLAQKCIDAGKPDALVRIACHELESWYLGDLKAVETGLGIHGLSGRQGEKKFKNPDSLANPVQELKKVTQGTYQKVGGSREIGPHLALEGNMSKSYQVFVDGVRRLVSAGSGP